MAKKPAKKRLTRTKSIVNRRAKFDYELGDTLIVGLELSGAEVKSLRMGHGQLRGAYVTLKQGELWLINATVAGTSGIPIADTDKTRARKLLAKKREIETLIESKQQGRTIVPMELLTQERYIKLRITLGKGRKRYDKRETLKRRESDRKIGSYLKTAAR